MEPLKGKEYPCSSRRISMGLGQLFLLYEKNVAILKETRYNM